MKIDKGDASKGHVIGWGGKIRMTKMVPFLSEGKKEIKTETHRIKVGRLGGKGGGGTKITAEGKARGSKVIWPKDGGGANSDQRRLQKKTENAPKTKESPNQPGWHGKKGNEEVKEKNFARKKGEKRTEMGSQLGRPSSNKIEK